MDALALLCRMEHLNQEVSMLRGAMEAQATVSQNLRRATVDLEHRFMEILTPPVFSSVNEPAQGAKQMETQSDELSVKDAKQQLREASNQQPMSPVWITVLKKGKPKLQKTLEGGFVTVSWFTKSSKAGAAQRGNNRHWHSE
ncbi:hypothetical protein GOODEAATRI_022625 [Goodea atripinnis]|uniref:Uncharacterized protein n=1 Tax=Goodea atripinnis TaxID=208336 RepID=A0ABV0NY70_9TELE